MKRRATETAALAFMKAVYPEMTELMIAAFDEQSVLTDATHLIEALRAEHVAHAEAIAFLNTYAEMPRGDSMSFDKAHYDELIHRLDVAHKEAARFLKRLAPVARLRAASLRTD